MDRLLLEAVLFLPRTSLFINKNDVLEHSLHGVEIFNKDSKNNEKMN